MNRSNGLLLGLLATLCLIVTWHYSVYRIKPDDDLLWLMQSSANFFSPAGLVEELYDEYREFLRTAGADNLWFVRADTREQLGQSHNYLVSSLWMNTSLRLVDNWSDAGFNSRLASAMLLGFPSQVLVICAGAIFLFCRSKAPNALIILALSLSGLVLFDLIGDAAGRTPNQDLISQSMMSSPLRFVTNFIQSILDPTPAFTLFYPTPKNQAQWLILIAVWFRWNGRYVASYATLVAGAAFHQDYMGLFIIAFVGVDLMLRPHTLNVRVAAIALAGILLYLMRGSLLWAALGGISPESILIIAIGLVAVFASAWVVGHICLRGLQQLPPVRSLSAATDLAVLGCGWLASLVLFIPINFAVDPASSALFWGNVHGRIYGMFYPAAILGLAILAVDSVAARRGRLNIHLAANIVVAGTLAGTLLVYGPGLMAPTKLHERIVDDLEGLSEADLSRLGPGGRAETVFYYDSLRRVDEG